MSKRQLPEEVRDAVRWLNEAGRSIVADALADWVEDKMLAYEGAIDVMSGALTAMAQHEADATGFANQLDAIAKVIGYPSEAWRIAGCDVLVHAVKSLQENYIRLIQLRNDVKSIKASLAEELQEQTVADRSTIRGDYENRAIQRCLERVGAITSTLSAKTQATHDSERAALVADVESRETPRTDAAAFDDGLGYDEPQIVVQADFARQLERELADVTWKLIDAQKVSDLYSLVLQYVLIKGIN